MAANAFGWSDIGVGLSSGNIWRRRFARASYAVRAYVSLDKDGSRSGPERDGRLRWTKAAHRRWIRGHAAATHLALRAGVLPTGHRAFPGDRSPRWDDCAGFGEDYGMVCGHRSFEVRI